MSKSDRIRAASDGMTVLDIADDDALRFVQRALEGQATEQDRRRARDMIVAIRTRLRSVNRLTTGVDVGNADAEGMR